MAIATRSIGEGQTNTFANLDRANARRVNERSQRKKCRVNDAGPALLAAVVDDACDLATKIRAMNDAIDEAVFQHELGGLKALG